MKFLSRLGQILLTATKIITGLGPILPQFQPQVNKATDTLEKVSGIITSVEIFGQVLGTPGADKLKAAAPLVAQVLLQSDMLVDKKIKDHALFVQGATKIADGMADVLNSLEDNIDTE